MAQPTITVRLNNYQVRVTSLDAGARLINRAVDDVRRGARLILEQGEYTEGKLLTGIESQVRYTAYTIIGRVGISGRRFPYAASVESGAERHIISARPPKTRLKFYWRRVGRVVFPAYVHHPGQTGKAYLRGPLAAAALRYNMRYVPYDL